MRFRVCVCLTVRAQKLCMKFGMMCVRVCACVRVCVCLVFHERWFVVCCCSRRKLAVVDENSNCLVYDLESKELLFTEVRWAAVSGLRYCCLSLLLTACCCCSC